MFNDSEKDLEEMIDVNSVAGRRESGILLSGKRGLAWVVDIESASAEIRD